MKNDHNAFEELDLHGLLSPPSTEASAWDFACAIRAALLDEGLSPAALRKVACWLITMSHADECGDLQ